MNRLVPEWPLPPYTFVPGLTVHPNHPGGHSHGKEPLPVEPLDPARWWECQTYLYGFDLFNSGYYWEAHETWEGLWHAAGRGGTLGNFLKALIALAACGVKWCEGRAAGAVGHARRAAALLGALGQSLGAESVSLGFRLQDLLEVAKLAESPGGAAERTCPAQAVFSFSLLPEKAG